MGAKLNYESIPLAAILLYFILFYESMTYSEIIFFGDIETEDPLVSIQWTTHFHGKKQKVNISEFED